MPVFELYKLPEDPIMIA